MSPSLNEALAHATTYWEAKGPSSRMMSIRAKGCASALSLKTPIEKLSKQDAAKVLTHLRNTGKSKGSIAAYYAAFKRAIELAGGDTRHWPKADTPPRRCREPLSENDLDSLSTMIRGYSYVHGEGEAYLARHGFHVIGPGAGGFLVRGTGWETYDLLELLRGTGLRVEREALNGEALTWDAKARTLRVVGKGGHERIIPVERPATVALLGDPDRMRAMRRLSYSGHLKRWNLALDRLKITSLKPTPHAVRHYYATRAYAKSGHNLKLVQELLGHADIATTARYLGVDMEEMRRAVS